MKRIVVLPDVHCPNYEEKAVEAVLKFIKFYKPNTIIQLGDFCDWDSVSTYEPRSEQDIISVDEEVTSANFLLDDIDSASNGCEKFMLGGNHEDRVAVFNVNHGHKVDTRRLRTLDEWHEEYNLEKRGWKHLDYGEHLKIGKLIFTHGWFTGDGAARRMAQCFPGRNVVFGHTHQHLIYGCMDENHEPIESESIGTLSKFNLRYLRGKPPINWIHSFMYIDMRDDGTFTKHYVRVIDGKFIEYGKEFSCA